MFQTSQDKSQVFFTSKGLTWNSDMCMPSLWDRLVRYNMSNALAGQDEAGIYKFELNSEWNFPEDNQTFA